MSIDPNLVFTEGVFPGGALEELRRQAREAEKEAADRFLSLARDQTLADTSTIAGHPLEADARFAELARQFDATILPQPEPEELGRRLSVIEAVLFNSGRPVFVVPYIWKEPLQCSRILAAWDGGIPSTRAIAAAMPLLKAAEWVQIVTIRPGRSDDLKGFEITRHLARHGVNAELKPIVSEIDVGSTLLSHVADAGADLIVMGAYGHSRLRETIFGGAREQLLKP